MSKLILPDESYRIMGSCFEVYKRMGCGFLEIEFEIQGIPFQTQPKRELTYREKKLKTYFVPDFICFDQIIVELKAVSKIIDDHRAQVINYLNATQLPLGLVVNFGHHPKVEYERIAYTQPKAS